MELIARRLEPAEWPEAARVAGVCDRYEHLPMDGGMAVGVFGGADVLGAARTVPSAQCLCHIELPAAAPQGARDYQAFLVANHPKRPHWFIGPVGVEPGRQREGIGTQAMQELVRLLTGAGLVCVEAEDQHVGFYERVGFRPTLRAPAPDGVAITFLEAQL